MSNLVENAIKYCPEGSHVTVKSREAGENIEIYVEDDGKGISEQDQENIFSKFYRVQDDDSHKTKGTGLGLYLVKYFIELHNGSIDLTSKVGTGSRFRIRLPMGA